jgi:hypothetical protein
VRSRPKTTRRLRRLPRHRIGERRVGGPIDEVAVVQFAEIGPVADDDAERRAPPLPVAGSGLDPGGVQPGRQFPEAGAVGASREQLGHDRTTDRMRPEPPRLPVALIAERGPRAGVDAVVDRARPRRVPLLADAVELPLGRGKHDAQREPAGLGVEVEAVLHRRECPARLADPFYRLQALDERATEAIELGHDDAVGESALDAVDRLGQHRPFPAPAGAVELLEHHADAAPVESRPGLDLLALDDR